MGVCINNNCLKGKEKFKNISSININIKEKNEDDIIINIPPEKDENQNKLDDKNELNKQNILEQGDKNMNQNQINKNPNEFINYRFSSRFKSRFKSKLLLNFSYNGHISYNSINTNNNYSDYTKNKNNFEKFIHFTDYTEKKNKILNTDNTNTN